MAHAETQSRRDEGPQFTLRCYRGCSLSYPFQTGTGLVGSVYEGALSHELEERGLQVERQKPIPNEYEGIRFEEGFLVDLIVEDCVVVELESVEALVRMHSRQLLTYLRPFDYRLGMLINS